MLMAAPTEQVPASAALCLVAVHSLQLYLSVCLSGCVSVSLWFPVWRGHGSGHGEGHAEVPLCEESSGGKRKLKKKHDLSGVG